MNMICSYTPFIMYVLIKRSKYSRNSWPFVGIIFAFAIFMPLVESAKILGLFAHPGESHFAVMRTIVMELSRREHNVTIYSSHRMHEKVNNVVEHVIEPEYLFWKEVQKLAGIKPDTPGGGLQALSQLPEATLQKYLGTIGAEAVDQFLSNKALQDLLHMDGTLFDYDLIIVDLFYTEALLAFGNYFNTPTIGIVSTNFENYMQQTLENMLPIACSPIDFETYDPYASYWTRLGNTRDCIARRKQFVKSNFIAQEQLIKKHFINYKGLTPTISQLHAELAILLLNNHVPLAIPRPMLPNTIAAGGLHIRPTRELPWHIKRFLDEARAGVIYINLGNEQFCGELSNSQLKLFFEVLGHRNERVLWTCHDVEAIDGAPKNMLFQHLVTQSDILAHPHVRVFIMNGELLSLQEGIVRHVPMIGIPIFRNELTAMQRAEELQIAINLDVKNLTADSLNAALDTLILKTEYATTIRDISAIFRDRPLGALETSMYWINYVLRHNGGAQLKTKGIGIQSSHLHLFDLFIFYFLMALFFVGFIVGLYFAGLWIWRKRQVEKMYSKLN